MIQIDENRTQRLTAARAHLSDLFGIEGNRKDKEYIELLNANGYAKITYRPRKHTNGDNIIYYSELIRDIQ